MKFVGSILLILMASGSISFADEPIARWDFDSEASVPLQLHGNVQRDQAGPRPPRYPGFAGDNTALRFERKGYLTFADPGPQSNFDFTNGDEITLEAWVRVDKARDGEQMYVVSKGRTESPKFAKDNQNWALRVVSKKGIIKASFLFATPAQSLAASGGKHWHRWTTIAGFPPGPDWHHVAVSYRFGEPKSIRGWIDGQQVNGDWDMGGATTAAPIVDDDAIWIGASRGGSASNRFKGWMDAVAIHRTIVAEEVMKKRFSMIGESQLVGPQPEAMPELGSIPDGRVLLTVGEEFSSDSRWLNDGETWPLNAATWFADQFLLSRLPVRYDDWGIRTNWKAPLLMRMAADVELPPGNHKFLVRVRSMSRLWIDGTLVARTKPARRRSGNEEPIVPVPEPLIEGARLLPFPQQEVFVEHEIPPRGAGNDREGRVVRVVLEWVVGGPQKRSETGEVLVAIQQHGNGTLHLLAPHRERSLQLMDAEVAPALERLERELTAYEDQTRRAAAASQNEFWDRRHALAKRRIEDGTVFSAVANNLADFNPIDAYIDRKIANAVQAAAKHDRATAEHFHGTVLPILRENCFRCHGEKDKGGLRLDSRAGTLKGGESELPAVVPGKPNDSELIVQVRDGSMPLTETPLSAKQIQTLVQWIKEGAEWPAPPVTDAQRTLAPLVDDASFLRRVYLDSVGVGPPPDVVVAFLEDSNPNKRIAIVNHLLNDERYADHWVSMWLDLLAENPTLLNASLNSTGPFRWFLHDALKDGKPLDRMVTELLLMCGDAAAGGSAGFGLAGENDSPMAAKAHLVASAFLGVEMQCARCHDSPYHSTTQADLYSLAAMLNRQPVVPPKTSRVPDEFFSRLGRQPLIRVTLKPDVPVEPTWPLASFTGIEDGSHVDGLCQNPADSRERLAALITAPDNQRFPRVIVNHYWKRLIGCGLVEPIHDWEGQAASHPELLDVLAREFVASGYDPKVILRRIMTSKLYQRQMVGGNQKADSGQRFFTAPDPRRLTAEQIVDSLFHASGRAMETEELTFVHDGSHPLAKRLTLGKPRRAWMFAGLNNERDRPSLSLPKAQPIVDVLEAFGWTGTRQQPISDRNMEANVLQPGILSNGTLTMSLTRAAYESTLAKLALESASPESLLDLLFLRFLSRYPTAVEKQDFLPILTTRFERRVIPVSTDSLPIPDSPLPQSTWTNHLLSEANEIQQEWQRRVRRGPPVDPRFDTEWRETYEDIIWSLVNHREFVWVP